MTVGKSVAQCVAVFVCLTILSAPVSAGDLWGLAGHVDAYDGWTGSASFNNGEGLSGTIDFAVFLAEDFNANFGGLGYVPGDALVYTYQLYNSGDEYVSAYIEGISNPADYIGTFSIGDVNSSFFQFDGSGNAVWQFTAPPIATGQTSWGMAFSSPNVPVAGVGLTVDGGGTSLVLGVPTPSATPIPEPASLTLLGFGLVVGLLGLRVRLRR